jgi:hypothetical protein
VGARRRDVLHQIEALHMDELEATVCQEVSHVGARRRAVMPEDLGARLSVAISERGARRPPSGEDGEPGSPSPEGEDAAKTSTLLHHLCIRVAFARSSSGVFETTTR